MSSSVFTGGSGVSSTTGNSFSNGWTNPTPFINVDPLLSTRGSSQFAKLWLRYNSGDFGSSSQWIQVRHFNSLKILRGLNGIGLIQVNIPIGADDESKAIQAILDGPHPVYLHATSLECNDGYAAYDIFGMSLATSKAGSVDEISFCLGQVEKIRSAEKAEKGGKTTVYELMAKDAMWALKQTNLGGQGNGPWIFSTGPAGGGIQTAPAPVYNSVGSVMKYLTQQTGHVAGDFSQDGAFRIACRIVPMNFLDALLEVAAFGGGDKPDPLNNSGTPQYVNDFDYISIVRPYYRYSDWAVVVNMLDPIDRPGVHTPRLQVPVEITRDAIRNQRAEETKNVFTITIQGGNSGYPRLDESSITFSPQNYPQTQDAHLYAPWVIYDNAGGIVANVRPPRLVGFTQWSMYQGGTKGVESRELVMGKPMLPKANGRKLRLGEVVDVVKNGNVLFSRNVTMIGYTQEEEALSIVIGIPDFSSQDDDLSGGGLNTLFSSGV